MYSVDSRILEMIYLGSIRRNRKIVVSRWREWRENVGKDERTSAAPSTSSSVICTLRFLATNVCNNVDESATPSTCPVVLKRYETTVARSGN